MITCKFDEFVRLQRGFDLPDSKVILGEYPVVAASNIKSQHNAYKVNPPVVVTGRSGTLGNVQYIDSKCWPLNTTLYSKDFRGNYPLYVYYYLKLMHLEQYNAGAGVPTLNQNHLHNIKIKIHPRKEQEHIASFLSTYDQLIENNTRRIALLEKMAQELYKEWFVRFRFPGHDHVKMVNGVPEGWSYRKLGEFINFKLGVGYTSKDIASGESTLLSMNNLQPYGGFIRDYSRQYCGKYSDDQCVQKNDLIMSITDMTQDRRIIGYTGLVSPSTKHRIISMHLLKLTSCEYNNIFLNYHFNFSGLSRVIAEYGSGANVLGITINTLNKVKTLLPPHELAERFVSYAKGFVEEIHKLNTINDNLTKQRDLLLPRLMSGKLELA